MCCPICRADYNLSDDGDRPMILIPCGHGGCGDCILKCLNEKKQCPICRKDVLTWTTNYQMMDIMSETKAKKDRIDEHLNKIGHTIRKNINKVVCNDYPKGIYLYADKPECPICNIKLDDAKTVDKFLDHCYNHITIDGKFKPY